MDTILYHIYHHKRINLAKLVPYGFVPSDDGFLYRKPLAGSGFLMTVTVTPAGQISTQVMDPAFGEPYTLHLIPDAVGSFVGEIRTEYEQILLDIAAQCCDPDLFQSEQAKELIAYVRSAHGDELEFLWKTFPNNAVWRRQDTKKWYAALLTVSKGKLGLDSDEKVEIIDLRAKPDVLETLVDGKSYYPGYHMNKKHWYTIILDGSVPLDEICRRIEESYLLAKK